MTHRVGIYYGAVALYRDLTGITVSDSRTECSSHHVFQNNIENNEIGPSGATNYYIFPRIARLHTVLQHSIHCNDELRILQISIFDYTS